MINFLVLVSLGATLFEISVEVLRKMIIRAVT